MVQTRQVERAPKHLLGSDPHAPTWALEVQLAVPQLFGLTIHKRYLLGALGNGRCGG